MIVKLLKLFCHKCEKMRWHEEMVLASCVVCGEYNEPADACARIYDLQHDIV